MKTAFAIIVALATIFNATTSGQTNASAGSVAATVSPTNATPSADVRLAVLEKELEVTKDFTQHMLATVYFCLGTAVVVLFAMVGFGWFQNVRAYERDKAALSESLATSLNTHLASKIAEMETQSQKRLLAFEAKIADGLSKSFQNVQDLHILMAISIFRATHFGKTPRTDFAALFAQVETQLDRISPEMVNQTLSVIIEYVNDAERIDSPTRTHLMTFAKKLPPECAGYADRLREVLVGKPD